VEKNGICWMIDFISSLGQLPPIKAVVGVGLVHLIGELRPKEGDGRIVSGWA